MPSRKPRMAASHNVALGCLHRLYRRGYSQRGIHRIAHDRAIRIFIGAPSLFAIRTFSLLWLICGRKTAARFFVDYRLIILWHLARIVIFQQIRRWKAISHALGYASAIFFKTRLRHDPLFVASVVGRDACLYCVRGEQFPAAVLGKATPRFLINNLRMFLAHVTVANQLGHRNAISDAIGHASTILLESRLGHCALFARMLLDAGFRRARNEDVSPSILRQTARGLFLDDRLIFLTQIGPISFLSQLVFRKAIRQTVGRAGAILLKDRLCQVGGLSLAVRAATNLMHFTP
jgi:hypothetical protein